MIPSTATKPRAIIRQPSETDWKQGNFLLDRTDTNAALVALIVFAICLAFGKSLSCGFLADDFYAISYLYQGFNGHPEVLLQRLISPWQEVDVQLFYRPVADLSLMLDYALHGPNPFWFHATNLLLHGAVSLLLFAVMRRLLKPFSMSASRAALIAFIAAALYAVHPLQTETVVWVIGRVDSLCALFYLSSFYLFVVRDDHKERRGIIHLGSLGCFALALGCKESAITLPIVLWFYMQWIENSHSLKERLKKCLPYAAVAGVFVALRTLVIGDLIGGYRGSIGQAYSSLPWHYALANGNFWKVFYPLNEDLIHPDDLLFLSLRAAYLIVGTLLVVRALQRREIDSHLKSLMQFCAVWFAIAIIPGWKLAIIQPTLAGGRFAYIPLLAGSSLCALLFLPLLRRLPESRGEAGFAWQLLRATAVAVAASFLALFVLIDRVDMRAWLQASHQVQSLRNSIEQTVNSLPAGERLLIADVPTHYHGAHVCYRYAMLKALLQPPFTSKCLLQRVDAMQLHHDGNLMNVSLYQRLAASPGERAFAWDSARERLVELPRRVDAPLAPAPLIQHPSSIICAQKQLVVEGNTIDRYVAQFAPPIDPSRVGTLMLTVTAKAPQHRRSMRVPAQLCWSNDNGIAFKEPRREDLAVTYDGQAHAYLCVPAEKKGWVLCGGISRISVDLPSSLFQARLTDLAALSADKYVPSLNPDPNGVRLGEDGVVLIGRKPTRFSFDASKVVGARAVLVEISAARCYFEHYAGKLHVSKLSERALFTSLLPGCQGQFFLNSELFEEDGIHQIRAFAVGLDGKIIGLSSDPVELSVTRKLTSCED